MKNESLVPTLSYAVEEYYERDQRGEVLLTSRGREWHGVTASHIRHRLREISGELGCHQITLKRRPAHVAGKFGSDRLKQPIQTGELVISPIGTMIQMRFDGQVNENINVTLTHACLRETAAACHLDPDKAELLPRFGFRDPVLETIVQTFLTELNQHDYGGRLLAESLAQQLAVHLLRHYSTVSLPFVSAVVGGLPAFKLKRVVDYIHEHLGDDLSFEELAAMAGYSPFYFARMFRRSTQRSPYDYVIDCRIERAKQLLSEGELSVLDITLATGFSTPSHFANSFKKRTGVSPRAFQQKMR